MKKKDLKLGEIYADNYGQPVLLVHDSVWSRQRRPGTDWYLHPSNAKQEKGRGYTGTNQGVLVVRGPVEDLRQIEIPDIHVFEATRNYFSEFFTKTLHEFEATLPEYCRLTVGFTRSWKGPFEEVEAKETALFEEREKRRAEAKEVSEQRRARARNVRDALGQMCIEVQGYTNTPLGERDLHVSGINGVTLSLADIEQILGLDPDAVPDPAE